ncbi:MAG: aminotransferase class I/II-fold pyridoxal phosphate-dependent enzyme [Alphaproteobacteria bacterium]|nr:aminotransferase class I/II-fold pyridoxal phosphate-dependent enzyme [Alphaproteobacteria bacterium]
MSDFSDITVPTLVDLQKIDGPNSTSLIVAQSGKEMPFYVRRNYFVVTGETAQSRGGHAHKKLWQLIIVSHGEAQINFEGAKGTYQFTLTHCHQGIIVPPGYWRDIIMKPESMLSVLASDEYDEQDYIRDYDEFQQWLTHGQTINHAPFLALDRCHESLRLPIEQALMQELKKNDFIKGEAVRLFEQNFANYCKVKHAIGCGNGFDALYLALRAQGVGANDEVIVPANSFVASALAVEQCGAKTVFVDCDNRDYGLDIDALQQAITPNSKAIIAVHLYGIPLDMDRVMAVADKHQLFVLEDAAQAHGADYKGRRVGSLGHAAAFSFYPTKNLGAIGDGGAVVTDNDELARKIRLLGNYGSEKKYEYQQAGINSRLDSVQAAVLNIKLGFLDEWNKKRRLLAEIYQNELASCDGVILPAIADNVTPVWHLYPIRLQQADRREAFLSHLKQYDIGYGLHYPVPIHQTIAYQNLAYQNQQTFIHTENLAVSEVSLPMSPFLSEDEIAYVCKMIKEFYQ